MPGVPKPCHPDMTKPKTPRGRCLGFRVRVDGLESKAYEPLEEEEEEEDGTRAHGGTRCLTTTSPPSISGGLRNRHLMQPRRINGKKQMRAGKTRQGRLKTATKSTQPAEQRGGRTTGWGRSGRTDGMSEARKRSMCGSRRK